MMHSTVTHTANHHLLTQRESEIVHLIAYEYSTKEIANLLFISFETAKTHRRNIQRKLGVRNVAGIVRAAFQEEILRVAGEMEVAV